MNPSAVLFEFSIPIFTSSHILRLDWLIVILFLLHVGGAYGQSIGSVSARQEGETIVISVADFTNLEVEDLIYFYSMDSGKNWNEIGKHCLEFEGADARWAVLDCMNTESFEGGAIKFKVDLVGCSSVRFDGYDYKVIQIGDQCWLDENLRTTVYANGEAIRGNLSDWAAWASTNSGAQAVYDNLKANMDAYGRLYNWHAVDDDRGLCPSGWHVPSDAEWTRLTDYLGGELVAGGQMKSSPSNTPSWNGSNACGLSALPGGFLEGSGGFYGVGKYGYWWSSSPSGSYNAWYRLLYSGGTEVHRGNYDRRNGFSVRCVQD